MTYVCSSLVETPLCLTLCGVVCWKMNECSVGRRASILYPRSFARWFGPHMKIHFVAKITFDPKSLSFVVPKVSGAGEPSDFCGSDFMFSTPRKFCC